MLCKLTIREMHEERKHDGKIIFGGQMLQYNLFHTIAASQMDAELTRRETAGEDISSVQVKRELFIFTVKKSDGKELDLTDDATFDLLLDLALIMMGCFCNDMYFDMLNDILGREDGLVEFSMKCHFNVNSLPASLRQQLGLSFA